MHFKKGAGQPTCDGVHGLPVAGRVGGALRGGGGGQAPRGAAGKVHVGAACPGPAQAPPRVEHATHMPHATGFVVATGSLRPSNDFFVID